VKENKIPMLFESNEEVVMSKLLIVALFLFGIGGKLLSEETTPLPKESGTKVDKTGSAQSRVKSHKEEMEMLDEVIEKLQESLKKASTPKEREEIARQIHLKKEEMELNWLKRKVEIARKSGNPEKIKEAEIALDKYLHPEKYREKVKPVKRELPITIEKSPEEKESK